MIVACPQCEGPFEVPDDRISPLCQVACPHCTFRMILDFAAANDPRLVEQGMKMASGFRSAAEYRHAVSSGWSPSGRPPPVRVVEEAPAEVAEVAPPPPPAAEAPPPPPPPPPVAEAPPPPPPPAARVPEHAPARAAEPARPPTTPPRTPTVVSAPAGTVPPPPPPPEPGDYDEEMPTMMRSSSSGEIPAISDSGIPEVIEAEAPARPEPPPPPERVIERAREPQPARPEPEPARREPAPPPRAPRREPPPPHPSASVGVDSGSMPASESGIGSSAELEVVRPSTFGTVMLVLLVLISLGLVVGSVLVHGTPDPRPLLEELWRRYLGG